ncbi:MAG: nitrate ABC transporter permease [Caulobacterales bacterium]
MTAAAKSKMQQPPEQTAVETAAKPAKAGAVVALPRKSKPPLLSGDLVRGALHTAAVIIPPLVVVLLLGLIWELGSPATGGLPRPSTIWLESKDLILDPFFDRGGVDKGLGLHVLTSLSRVAVGYGFAALVGIALGVLVGQSLTAHRGLDPIFQVLRTVPPLAWLPISLAMFQQAQPSALFVIFITSIWPILINTAVGIRNIPQDYRNVSRVLRLSPYRHFVLIMLPAATPYIFTGLRIGIGMAWLAIVASEMLLGGVGVGFFIWDQYNSGRIADIVVALAWVGLVGFALDRVVAGIGKLVARGSSN